jgi:hypothetical protein
MHVYQHKAILGDAPTESVTPVASRSHGGHPPMRTPTNTIDDGLEMACVDHSQSLVFAATFYVVLLQNAVGAGPLLHMWLVTMANNETADNSSRMNIQSQKVFSASLPLAMPDTRVLTACASAGHLASASLYPACRTPYALVTVTDDDIIRCVQARTWYIWLCIDSGSVRAHRQLVPSNGTNGE